MNKLLRSTFLCDNCHKVITLNSEEFLRCLIIPPTDYYKVIYINMLCHHCNTRMYVKIGKDAGDEYNEYRKITPS